MSIFNRIKILQGDICNYHGDAIVNAANSSLLGGGGVDGAIHFSAGIKLLEECRKLNGCKTGEAKITAGYNLQAKFIIHTVGPIWQNGRNDEASLLKNGYNNSLKLALKNGIRTIAFPSISTGAYGYPFKPAAKIALETVFDFLQYNPVLDEVAFYCFSKNDFDIFNKILYDFKKRMAIPQTANIAPKTETNPNFSL
ncbi:MAG: O-acetyl-ADP-ribose deacetylase [Ignavibacteria bacterium]|nr:O-acetyl-ADP-ribose deacetylase [Ignavibacteria bacterium]